MNDPHIPLYLPKVPFVRFDPAEWTLPGNKAQTKDSIRIYVSRFGKSKHFLVTFIIFRLGIGHLFLYFLNCDTFLTDAEHEMALTILSVIRLRQTQKLYFGKLKFRTCFY